MTEEDYLWLKANEVLMYRSIRSTPETIQRLYDIFNRITGLNKKPNGCGSCLRNTINTLKVNYEKYRQTTA